MFRRLALPLFLALTLAVFPGCGVLQKATHPKKRTASTAPRAPRPVNIGKIVLVNEESKFVLIDGGELPSPAPDATLTSYTGNTESGTLLATKIARRPHIIADIKGGAPKKGDRVMALPVLPAQAATPVATAVPAAQTPAAAATAPKKPWWKMW
jgi:hypothetical protein